MDPLREERKAVERLVLCTLRERQASVGLTLLTPLYVYNTPRTSFKRDIRVSTYVCVQDRKAHNRASD